jgi:hypothetical protein
VSLCPSCGQVITPATDRIEELVGLLRQDPSLNSVYRAQAGGWYITYSAKLPRYQPFTDQDVRAAAARGLLNPTYAGCNSSYDLTPDARGGPSKARIASRSDKPHDR